MRTNTPSVTTSIGAEGMCGDLKWPGFVANSIEGIVAGAVELYQSESRWQQAVESIPEILADRYDGEKSGAELIKRIQSIENNLEQHRLNNFVGEMLKHHSHRSTKFMSQWIEEKNKNQSREN